MRTERWRLIEHLAIDTNAPEVELFDYQTHPEETRNHAAAHPEVVAESRSRLPSL
ncbi:MAG: hypothetical protein ACKV19_13755 [Verrucomicrobiales bacterium]